MALSLTTCSASRIATSSSAAQGRGRCAACSDALEQVEAAFSDLRAAGVDGR